MLEILPARFRDAVCLAERLRFEDARELAASWGLGARAGLCACLLQSDRAFALWWRGRVVALYGLVEGRRDGLVIAMPWLLAAEEMFRHRSLLMLGRRWVDHLLVDCDALTNLTDARNAAHLRWLGWCGFRRLREHASFGAEGRRFVEFYRENPRRHRSPEVIRAVLLRRRPGGSAAALDPALGRLVELAVPVLRGGDPDAWRAALPDVLASVAPDGSLARFPPRTRRACLRLLLELGAVVAGSARGSRASLAGELCTSLAELAGLVGLEEPSGAETLLTGAPSPASPAAPVTFESLVRDYGAALGGDGVSRVHGHRLRLAAAGLTDGELRRPLGLPLAELERLFEEHHLALALAHGGSLPLADLVRPALELQARPLPGGAVTGRFRAAWDPRTRLGQTLDRLLDDPATPRLATAPRTVADAWHLAGVLADRVVRELLGSLRLGAVVAGYRDRQWLYRLLRAHLLLTAVDGDRTRAAPLLQEEVTALLLAARVEDALLAVPEHAPWPDQLGRVVADCLHLLGPGVVVADGLAPVARLLLVPLAAPVLHAAQREPALLAWHLACRGRLGDVLQRVSHLVGEDGQEPRRRLRAFLRRLGREVAMVDVQRHLEIHG